MTRSTSLDDAAINEQAERLYWRFKSLTDRTQTNPPMSERDAFKAVTMRALRDALRGRNHRPIGT